VLAAGHVRRAGAGRRRTSTSYEVVVDGTAVADGAAAESMP
jgi:hypothetical protein